jgi:hypothetical protein
MTNQTREIAIVLGSFAVIMIFYFGAASLWNGFRPPDSALAKQARSIMSALQEYRASRGAYPVLLPRQDGSIVDLKKKLASDGFLGAESGEFTGPDKDARYTSNGRAYALMFHVDPNDSNPSGKCHIEFVERGLYYWGPLPRCEF